MDQKNTIVKCNLTNCLYNYKGICDNYVIRINSNGKCENYVETTAKEDISDYGVDLSNE